MRDLCAYKFQDIAQRYATIQVKFLKVLHNVQKKRVAQIEAHHTIESFLFEKNYCQIDLS